MQTSISPFIPAFLPISLRFFAKKFLFPHFSVIAEIDNNLIREIENVRMLVEVLGLVL